MFANKLDYLGIPPEMVKDLEVIAQATVTQLFDLTRKVWEDPSIELWNCSVYRSTVPVKGVKGRRHKRIRIKNHSSGYWAVLEYGQESFCSLPQYKDTWDFWAFSTVSDNKHVNPRSIDWDKYMEEWGLGRADHYWQARKLSYTDGWYASCHALSFKHPLLMLMRQGVEKPA